MSSAKLTLIGLYSFDNTLFDNLTLPTGINKDTLIDTILLRGGEFETLYPDPVFMKYSIGAWSRKWNATLTRWINALSIEYNPLENYNRMEDWADSEAGTNEETSNNSESGQHADSELETQTGTGSSSTNGRTNSTTKHKISADDAGDNLTMRDQDEVVGADQSSSSNANTLNTSGATSGDYQKSEDFQKNGAHATAGEHHGVIHGNIGVTTSQQMLLSELDLGYWNLYEKITDLFLTEFVLPVY